MNSIDYRIGLDTSDASDGFGSVLGLARGLAGKITGIFSGIGGKLAEGLGIGSLADNIERAISSAAGLETTSRAFETLTGSVTKATKVIGQLRDLGAQTPFEFPELAQSGRSLIAFGQSSETVAGTLRRIGDIAAGVQTPISDLATLYGKARVAGTLYAEDINQLLERGIPILQEFGKQLKVQPGEVKKLGEQGLLTFPMLEKAFVDMTSAGGKFAGMMEVQSRTMAGMWSTLKDNIGQVFTAIGQPINDALRPYLEKAIDYTGRLQAAIPPMIAGLKAAGELMGKMWQKGNLGEALRLVMMGALTPVRNLISGLGNWFKDVFSGAAEFIWRQMGRLFSGDNWKQVGAMLSGVFSAAFSGLPSIIEGIGKHLQAAFTSAVAMLGDDLKRKLMIPLMAFGGTLGASAGVAAGLLTPSGSQMKVATGLMGQGNQLMTQGSAAAAMAIAKVVSAGVKLVDDVKGDVRDTLGKTSFRMGQEKASPYFNAAGALAFNTSQMGYRASVENFKLMLDGMSKSIEKTTTTFDESTTKIDDVFSRVSGSGGGAGKGMRLRIHSYGPDASAARQFARSEGDSESRAVDQWGRMTPKARLKYGSLGDFLDQKLGRSKLPNRVELPGGQQGPMRPEDMNAPIFKGKLPTFKKDLPFAPPDPERAKRAAKADEASRRAATAQNPTLAKLQSIDANTKKTSDALDRLTRK